MTTGRKPKPTAIRRLQGNMSQHKLNDAEPKLPVSVVPVAPDHLTPAAKAEWVRVAAMLVRSGVLTDGDTGMLAMYCQAYGRWVGAELKLAKMGDVLKGANGYYQNPHLHVANKAMLNMLKAAIELGMTPSARSRIKVEKPSESLADILFSGVDSGTTEG